MKVYALRQKLKNGACGKRLQTCYLDIMARTIDEGIDMALVAIAQKLPVSIGVLGNAVDLLERMEERGIVPDTLTDQTSAHDPLVGYLPARAGRRSC